MVKNIQQELSRLFIFISTSCECCQPGSKEEPTVYASVKPKQAALTSSGKYFKNSFEHFSFNTRHSLLCLCTKSPIFHYLEFIYLFYCLYTQFSLELS